ncbi:hypothetical protein HanRHA438_Chr14g0657661 [Helianthus annuus]|uniref:Uncharacterized protein n=1 Tax=Helianthus annuus TaxID=4232 RepID=A0A251SLT0_HELAN|nr:hypothetical protein HanXRQr2_Chr14g0647111 [Helianthus annuus]KAJ0464393.1 hypothetical protein HanHA300_Chr14g0526631 [Helianthus annuus]KAJ0468888.1 hypothetical protein HanIR_Chr14g0701781 [Helianthus annuus]KAJ0485964.1 hypothetical protein HanHA89_Chr14g0574301 [Helianthus annuus]KAJ0656519.1 hypothetical protein HanLR1_Chr14g0536711 [Helianthus annuus]
MGELRLISVSDALGGGTVYGYKGCMHYEGETRRCSFPSSLCLQSFSSRTLNQTAEPEGAFMLWPIFFTCLKFSIPMILFFGLLGY